MSQVPTNQLLLEHDRVWDAQRRMTSISKQGLSTGAFDPRDLNAAVHDVGLQLSIEKELNRRAITAGTGETCPVSGIWVPGNDLASATKIEYGDRVPTHDGRAVTWKLQTVLERGNRQP